jgi:hypothetical protein
MDTLRYGFPPKKKKKKKKRRGGRGGEESGPLFADVAGRVVGITVNVCPVSFLIRERVGTLP